MLPLGARRVIARSLHACRVLAAPLVAFVLFNGVLLAWHLPALFDLTLRNAAVHDLEHALFFVTALLFWTHLTPTSRRPRLGAAQRVAYGVGAILVSWVLAVVLGFASHPLYGHYAALAHRPGGLSALADQQLAAGIMWVPASIPFTIAVLVAAYDLLEPSKKRSRARPTTEGDLMLASFLTASLLTLLLPVGLLVGVGIWWTLAGRRRDEV